MSTTDAFTLEASRNNFSSYGSPEPVDTDNISAIWGYTAQNSSGVKIMDDKGQELKLTKDGLEQLADLKDHIEANFLPAKDHLNDDHQYLVNPSHVSYKGETIEDDEDVATVQLKNGQKLYLIDDEFKYGLNPQETEQALGVHKHPQPTPDPFA